MHIYAGLMVWRDMSARHGQCLADLQLLCRERGIGFTNGTIYGDALVSRAQSIAASEFLRSDADVMWTCGSDTLFDPEDVITLCQKAMDGHDIIGAVVMKRQDNPTPACPIPEGGLIMDADQSPVEVRYMGTGFSATHRRVFEALEPHIPLCSQNTASTPFWPFVTITLPSSVPIENPIPSRFPIRWGSSSHPFALASSMARLSASGLVGACNQSPLRFVSVLTARASNSLAAGRTSTRTCSLT